MLHCFDPIRTLSFWAILVRLTLAVVCGGVIGAERETKRRPAGFRTHILICLGAAITTLTSQYLLLSLHLFTDVARLGAQVISGIGFIGAGTIIVTRDKRVKGLTTAAGLWAAAIIGLACGAGAGLTLTSGCSGGGEEILGLLCLQKHPLLSVGRISMALNFAVYGVGFLFFDRQVVVYSILFTCVTFLCLDRAHLQNVMVTMLIITKKPEMEQLVFEYVGRGVTKWEGEGAYSGEQTEMLLTVVSKKEALQLRKALQKQDPNIFVILDDNISVVGNFQKRV